MKIENCLELPYQRSLIFAALEFFSASDLLREAHGGQSGANVWAWKNAVITFLHRNLVSELIVLELDSVAHDPEVVDSNVLDALMGSDPNENPEIWMGIQFRGTDKLISLAAFHGMLGWDCIQSSLNRDFIDAVSGIYTENS